LYANEEIWEDIYGSHLKPPLEKSILTHLDIK
jgi:hypothetical protein